MLIVLAIIAAVILTTGIILYINFNDGRDTFEYLYCTFNAVGGIMLGIIAIVALILGFRCSQVIPIEEKIAIYKEENTNIENQIAAIVENYKNYEVGTLKDLKMSDSPAVVLSMYPELKSDALIVKQIEVYIENNKAIKELRAQKADYRIYAWWLYFGGTAQEESSNSNS